MQKSLGDILRTATRPNVLIWGSNIIWSTIKTKVKKEWFKCVEAVISGGDILTSELKRKIDLYLRRNMDQEQKVRPGYGLTEATAATCLTNEFKLWRCEYWIPFPDTY